MKRLKRIAIFTALAVAVLLVAGSITAVLVFNSNWFRDRVRERAIMEIEKATGARVELGNFSFDGKRLTATIGPLILHGLEPAGDPPLLVVRSVTISLRIVSMLERKVDLASINIEQPLVHMVFYADGSTNLPSPRVHDSKSWAEDILNFRVGRYEIVDGMVDYGDRRIPLNLRGEDVRMKMAVELANHRYRGDLTFQRMRITPPGFPPFELAVASSFAFDKSSIEVSRLHVSTKESRADLSGILTDPRAPHGTLKVKSTISVREAVAIFQLPLARTGKASFDGQIALSFSNPFDFTLAGRADAQGLGYVAHLTETKQLNIDNASLRANISLTKEKLALDRIAVTARGATLTGAGELLQGRDFHFEGKFGGLTVAEAAKFVTDTRIPWDGNVAGSVTLDAKAGEPSGVKLQTTLAIEPESGGQHPIEGEVAITYDQASGAIRFADSHLATAAARIDFSGTLNETLNLHAQSTNLDDLLPALSIIDDNAPKELFVKLNPMVKEHRAEFQGTVTKAQDNPLVRGQLSLVAGIVEGHSFDGFSSTLDATRSEVHLTQLTMSRSNTQIEGSASIGARNGSFDDGAISAQLNVRGAQLAELIPEFAPDFAKDRKPFDISGGATAVVHLSGTIRKPGAEVAAQIDKLAAFGEQIDHLRANLRYSPASFDIDAGEADAYGGKLYFQGSFQPRTNNGNPDFKNGNLQFDVASQNVTVSRVAYLNTLVPNADATVDGKAVGAARIVNGELILDSINGDATAHGIIWDKQPRGDLTLSAVTHGSDLAIHANGKLHELSVDAQGSWKLVGDEVGTATIRVSRADVNALRSVFMAGGPLADSELPFDGFVDGVHGTISVALRKPAGFRAEMTIDQVQLNAKPAQTPRLGVQTQDLTVKNSKPVALDITSKEARIRSAEFSARETNLEITGAVPFDSAAGAGLAIHGSVNLIILQLLNPDLVARGNAVVQASVRGSLLDPQLSGRMELKNASLYLSDLPNGVDNANGAVTFDRNRATIEKLTAETGGGTIKFTGFIGFGSTLVYRLQAIAEKVRVRYPEDVSTTFNSTLALNGTSDASTVSGIVTLTRASFTPRADFAQILAQAGRPASASVTSSEYIRGMQFDVRIESGPNFEFQTSLTRNLEAGIDLRLRGTPLRPALIGTVSVNDGEVQMFGNRYTVNRGDIRFVNPVKVDPILDMDLETKARGVTVNIAISGTMQKLNVNYSSDPPMQPREIIALLAVGRTPTEATGLAAPSATSSTSLNDAGGGLIGQAISAQLNSRLQRFFGASRVKIDPTLNSVEYLPQARLTLEQQISKDITLTYITNLNRTQEQIVQIEWDFSRQWSAVAVREASGLFGIDFQYKKRFK